jgi:hypothetical protein
MNAVRIWVLRIASIIALGIGAYLLYDSYQDLTWTRQAIEEAGAGAYRSGPTQDYILSQSTDKNRSGAASEHFGFLLIAAALIMDGIASVIKKLEKNPVQISN